MCEQCRRREDADRLLWQTVRRALLMVAAAIQKRYDVHNEPKQVRRAA